MIRWPSALLVLSACNGLLGLEGALPNVDVDGDGFFDRDDNCPQVSNADQVDGDSDGIGDACDNCPSIANSDQFDRDRDRRGDVCDGCPDTIRSEGDSDSDGVDDACDSCLLGPPDDDDADGEADACDLCPGVAAEQADIDGDVVGDGCDPNANAAIALNRRALFEPFHTLAAWQSADAWIVQPDGSSVSPTDPGGAPTLSRLTTIDDQWSFNRLDIAVELGDSASLGVGSILCTATCSGQTCTLDLVVGANVPPPITGSPSTRDHLSLVFSQTVGGAQGPSTWLCQLGSLTVQVSEFGLGQDRGALIIEATPSTKVMSVDLVE